jgi:hypothetical protein
MSRTQKLAAILLTSVVMLGLAGCPHQDHHDHDHPPPPPMDH